MFSKKQYICAGAGDVFLKMLLDYCVSSSRWHILHRVIKGNKNGRQCKKSKNINSKTSCQHQFASTRQTLTKKGCSCKEAYLSNSPHDGFVLQIHKPNIFCVWHLNLPCWHFQLTPKTHLFQICWHQNTQNSRFSHQNTLIHIFWHLVTSYIFVDQWHHNNDML